MSELQAEGKSQREIAEEVGVTRKTVAEDMEKSTPTGGDGSAPVGVDKEEARRMKQEAREKNKAEALRLRPQLRALKGYGSAFTLGDRS